MRGTRRGRQADAADCARLQVSVQAVLDLATIARPVAIAMSRAKAHHSLEAARTALDQAIPVRPDPVLTTAELPFRFTQNVRTDVNSG